MAVPWKQALRQGPWKLLISEQDTSLFHLENNLGEIHNLARQYPDTLFQLILKWNDWEEEMDQTGPQKTI